MASETAFSLFQPLHIKCGLMEQCQSLRNVVKCSIWVIFLLCNSVTPRSFVSQSFYLESSDFGESAENGLKATADEVTGLECVHRLCRQGHI